MTTLNLPCGQDLNHLRIQLSDGLNLTALIDHLETCEKCGLISKKSGYSRFRPSRLSSYP